MRIIFLIIILLTSACNKQNIDPTYPKSDKQENDEKYGQIGNTKVITLFGGQNKEAASVHDSITVNKYIWRAALDNVSFMPIIVSDPFGGVISTDWYNASAGDERIRMTIIISSQQLRADSLTISMFKQVMQNNKWCDASVSNEAIIEVENKILTTARKLKLSSQEAK